MISSQADPAAPRNRGRTSQTAQRRACAHQPEKAIPKNTSRCAVTKRTLAPRKYHAPRNEYPYVCKERDGTAEKTHATPDAEQLRKKSHNKFYRDEDRFGGSQTQMPGQSQLKKKKTSREKRCYMQPLYLTPPNTLYKYFFLAGGGGFFSGWGVPPLEFFRVTIARNRGGVDLRLYERKAPAFLYF